MLFSALLTYNCIFQLTQKDVLYILFDARLTIDL